jgi:hypothetical protein
MISTKRFTSLTALLILVLSGTPLSGAVVLNLNSYAGTGGGEFTLSNASATGATITYNAPSTRYDIGTVATISSGSLTPFSQVGDTLNYSFSLGSISVANNLFSPVYRVGFDFGSTGILRYATSTGSGPRIEFASNDNGNPFSGGNIHVTHEDWSENVTGSDNSSLRFDDGNDINATVSLELVNIDGSLFDYEMTVTYQSTISTSVSNSKSYTFTGVSGDQVVSLFHVTNKSGLVANDTYTISNASLQFTAVPEPSTYGFALGIVAMAFLWMRRRKSAH